MRLTSSVVAFSLNSLSSPLFFFFFRSFGILGVRPPGHLKCARNDAALLTGLPRRLQGHVIIIIGWILSLIHDWLRCILIWNDWLYLKSQRLCVCTAPVWRLTSGWRWSTTRKFGSWDWTHARFTARKELRKTAATTTRTAAIIKWVNTAWIERLIFSFSYFPIIFSLAASHLSPCHSLADSMLGPWEMDGSSVSGANNHVFFFFFSFLTQKI